MTDAEYAWYQAELHWEQADVYRLQLEDHAQRLNLLLEANRVLVEEHMARCQQVVAEYVEQRRQIGDMIFAELTKDIGETG